MLRDRRSDVTRPGLAGRPRWAVPRVVVRARRGHLTTSHQRIDCSAVERFVLDQRLCHTVEHIPMLR